MLVWAHRTSACFVNFLRVFSCGGGFSLTYLLYRRTDSQNTSAVTPLVLMYVVLTYHVCLHGMQNIQYLPMTDLFSSRKYSLLLWVMKLNSLNSLYSGLDIALCLIV